MNIFKKLYQKYIVGISYPIDNNATGEEKLKHLGIDKSHPFYSIYADMLNEEPVVVHTFQKGEYDYDSLLLAFAHKEIFFGNYIITNMNKDYDGTCIIYWTYIENVDELKIEKENKTMNEELDDLTWLKLNFQNRMVERTLKICGMTINDIINRYNEQIYKGE